MRRGSLQITWLILAIITCAGMVWSLWRSQEATFSWRHIIGFALMLLFVFLIWLWPGGRKHNQPPP
jgi:hypothetical protein